MRVLVRFARDDSDDMVYARAHFAHLGYDPTLQLLEQFKSELYQNRCLRGCWTVSGHYASVEEDGEPGVLRVWVAFDWQDSLVSFAKELQRTFDECGMSGHYQLLDGVGQDGRLYSAANKSSAMAQALCPQQTVVSPEASDDEENPDPQTLHLGEPDSGMASEAGPRGGGPD